MSFFLGGYDLEMLTIRKLLQNTPLSLFFDKHLQWGAKSSAYKDEIKTTLSNGQLPVLVELENDIELSEEEVVFVDHHGKRAGKYKPTSLHQIFDMLALPRERWSRWHELVAANDRGYIPGMLEAGATHEEITKVRFEDRRTQGITEKEEREARESIKNSKILAGGTLRVINISHAHTSCVSDFMQPGLGGAGYKNLIVFSPKQVNFFGNGELVLMLNETFPGGWFGGALPEIGFWGHNNPSKDILNFIAGRLEWVGGKEVYRIL